MMKAEDLRIVFMGTPEFAVPSLEALVNNGFNIVAVVTAPDKPAGRGLKVQESNVKIASRWLGITTVLQPERLKDETFIDAMRALKPDLGIVIAFRMLPEVIWAMPRFGTFNLHASLLPQYRGAAPINWAIINGEKETGVTTFLLNHEIDKGAVIGQIRMPIGEDDTIGTMYDKLMNVGVSLVLDSVKRIATGEITPIEQPQSDENLHPAPKIFKDDCLIRWNQSGRKIIDFIRGLSPYPAAWSRMYHDNTETATAKIFSARFEPASLNIPVGTINSDGKSRLAVSCIDGWILIDEIQISGKRRMHTRDLLLGFRNIETYTLG